MNLEQFGGLSELETVETAMLCAKDYEQTPALKVFKRGFSPCRGKSRGCGSTGIART